VVQAASRVAAPEPEPEPEPAVGVAPIALQVDKFGIDAPIEIGAIADGVMQDPSGPWVVAWYDQLGKVRERNNVVMAGHVDYYTVGPAVFWNVRDLVPGDIVRVIDENGEAVEYSVEWAQMYDVATELTPEVIQTDIVGDTGKESLTLITCGGPFDPATGQYLQRFVVRAHQI
jgi:sortase A